MRGLVAAAGLTAMLASGGAYAQSQLDHDVQKTWDNLFNPGPRGDPRTNWERRRDTARYDEQRAAQQADWCRYHPGAGGCGRAYGNGAPPGYYGR